MVGCENFVFHGIALFYRCAFQVYFSRIMKFTNQTLVPFILWAGALLHAQDYTLGPDSQPRDGVPKGTVTKLKLEAGKFYPGTPTNYAIYSPAHYTAANPAPFMIFLDGSGSLNNSVRVPVVFDNLIASGDLPPLIGIFVDPGTLPAVSDTAQNRFERVFEYDSLSDRHSRFLLEELIPEVAKKYNLSKDPDDHALSGVSTGAVGAFAAAGNRPDQFHRVLSFIGTFVAMKGADGLPALIRNTEPKPIRIFLQDGKNDHVVPTEPYGTFYAGSWPINNQVMFEAFQSAGYDVKLVIGEEGHNMKQGAAIMPEALRWLWRGYPSPIVAREPADIGKPGWDPQGKVYSIVSADKTWEQVGEAHRSVVSPTCDQDGNVFFADPAANRIYKSDADRQVTLFKDNSGGARVLRIVPDGRLYASQPRGSASYRTARAATKKSWRKMSRPATWRSRRRAKSTSPMPTARPLATSMGKGRRASFMMEAKLRSRPASPSLPTRRCSSSVQIQLEFSDRGGRLADERRALLSFGNAGSRMD